MVKAILFDWFGVCAETWLSVWVRELGKGVEFERLGKAFVKRLDALCRGEMPIPVFLEQVLGEAGVDSSRHEILLHEPGKIDRKMLGLVLRLRKNYRTALVSDITSEFHAIIEKRIGPFSNYFDAVALSYQHKAVKADRKLFHAALDSLGLPASQCVFIDDRQRNIDVAESLGIKAIPFKAREQLEASLSALGIRLG